MAGGVWRLLGWVVRGCRVWVGQLVVVIGWEQPAAVAAGVGVVCLLYIRPYIVMGHGYVCAGSSRVFQGGPRVQWQYAASAGDSYARFWGG